MGNFIILTGLVQLVPSFFQFFNFLHALALRKFFVKFAPFFR